MHRKHLVAVVFLALPLTASTAVWVASSRDSSTPSPSQTTTDAAALSSGPYPGQEGAIPALVLDESRDPSLAPAYGRKDLSFDTLAAKGAICRPEPKPAVKTDDQAPPIDSVPHDYSGVLALNGISAEIYGCMVQCLPTDQRLWTGLPLATSRECFDDSVSSIVKVAGLGETWQVMSTLLRSQPTFSYFCHTTGHRAGLTAVKEHGLDPVRALKMVNGDCLSGALHGILDAFAESSPTRQQFEAMIDVCVELDNTQCADGVGHGAWSTFESYAVAADICGRFADRDFRFTCDGGVFMREVSVGALAEEFPDLDNLSVSHAAWQRRMVKMCAQWAEANTRNLPDEEPGEGCWTVSGYEIWMPLVEFVRENGSWRDIPGLGDRLAEIRGTCAGFGPIGEPICVDKFGEGVAALSGYDLATSEEMCAMIEEIEQVCVATASELITYASKVR